MQTKMMKHENTAVLAHRYLVALVAALVLAAGILGVFGVRSAYAEGEPYTITVVSEDVEGKPVWGYQYELRLSDGTVVHVFDFMDKDKPDSQSFKVNAGFYYLYEVKRPERYEAWKEPVVIEFPFKDALGKEVVSMTITPKHGERTPDKPTTPPDTPDKPKKPKNPNPYLPKTGELAQWGFSAAVLMAGILLFAGAARSKSRAANKKDGE